MRNVILVDFPPEENWEFRSAVEETTKAEWDVICLQSNQNHGSFLQTLIRYAKYFFLPARIFLQRKKYGSVIAWQQFFGIILACYMRFFRVRHTPDITVMTFIYNPKKSWIGRLYYSFVRYAVTSEYIKHIIVFSENETAHYTELFGTPKGKFVFVRLAVEDVKDSFCGDICDGGYYVTAGRSNRDYGFLKAAWRRQKRDLRIICDELDDEDEEKITYLKDCHNDAYLKEMAGCHGVIVPLDNENVSSGQLVLLHAMMLGKPIIVTQNKAALDYVHNGYNGLVIEKSEQALSDAISKLEDAEFCRKMSEAARACFEEKHSLRGFGQRVGEILNRCE